MYALNCWISADEVSQTRNVVQLNFYLTFLMLSVKDARFVMRAWSAEYFLKQATADIALGLLSWSSTLVNR